MGGRRHTQLVYSQGHLGDKILLERCMFTLCDRQGQQAGTAGVMHLPNNKFPRTCVAMMCASLNFVRFINLQIRQPWHYSLLWQFWRRWALKIEILHR